MRNYLPHVFLTVCAIMMGVVMMSFTARAADTPAVSSPLSMTTFAQLPILQDGRLKPIDSFARFELARFAKKDTLPDMDAMQWLATAVFDPAQSADQKIFLIENATTRHLMGLEERAKPLYSYAELVGGLEKTKPMVSDLMDIPAKQQNADQKDLLALHENALEYTFLLRSFSSILPLNVMVPPEWRSKAGLSATDPVTFLALKKVAPDLEEKIRSIMTKKGKNPATYTRMEQSLVTLGWQIRTIGDAGENNTLFRVIPTAQAEDWASPWELINDGKSSPATTLTLEKWAALSHAWQKQDAALWTQTLNDLATSERTSFDRMAFEVTYNQIAPFTTAIFVFAAALGLGLLFIAGRHRLFYRLGYIVLLGAVLLQGGGLATRIYLMERPPVGTLYESILFVGFVAPFVAIFMERRLRNGIGLLSGSIAGVMLGILSYSMAGEGDTMKVLGAVLNTRFWLTTHVLCITIGYGWCLVTSVLAHIILIGKASGRMTATAEAQLIRTMTTHSLFALLFTTVGTILGGIWADQSWGRFWGWDPKENGAMLITVWLIWLIHGKLAGQISQRVWIGGLALVSIVVAVAWVGVNLLGVGLHSYGFIEGVFWGLGAFSLFEIILVTTLTLILSKQEAKAHAV